MEKEHPTPALSNYPLPFTEESLGKAEKNLRNSQSGVQTHQRLRPHQRDYRMLSFPNTLPCITKRPYLLQFLLIHHVLLTNKKNFQTIKKQKKKNHLP